MPQKDIQTRADIEQLIRAFYTKILADNQLNFIFTDIAQLDLETHFPHLFDFWENILLAPNHYRKNVLQIHLDLNKKIALTPEHFQQWLGHFSNTVDELFTGDIAQQAKNKALSIATVMQTKLHSSNNLL